MSNALRTRAVLPSVVAAVALLAAGCGPDEAIRSYRVPKSADAAPTAKGPTPAAAGDFRMLGAMFPADNPVWFFKFGGPADQIEKFEAGFDQLIASVKLAPGGKVPEFALPEGWKKNGPRPGFVPVAETVIPPDSKLEVTMTYVTGGGVEGNLERWVKQIGLKPGSDDVAKYTRTIDAAGGKGVRSDLRGPSNPATSRGPMMGGR